ncbi:TVP38/TMEM64 family protein [Merismopedia glauca]|uniref:TVP38/TMEM64 family membrane protein n=1 Tax=Merismopedia glauca CCAP 1448/3 TaxID=1296344 RepID=A0A2T1C4N1_9CYAN|nr:TVP38/TMEM64 family protein [Merismopedia glauca]PSB03097.1 TVP38/TMEM64 family protein [Merismopedia glauca CCAP 1448/3]
MLKEPVINRLDARKKRIISYIMMGFSLAILIISAKYLNLPEILRNLLRWVDSLGNWGPIAFIIIYNLATILFIPGSILTLGGGVIYGVLWGSIYVSISAIIGAIVAFTIGRYISRDWVAKQMAQHPKFKAIEEAVSRSGIKIVLLTRLCPIFPFNLLNYAFGVTQVSLRDYVLGSLGMIPGTVMYVYLGSIVGDLAMLDTPGMMSTNPQTEMMKWVINIISVAMTIAVTVYLAKIARQALEQEVK